MANQFTYVNFFATELLVPVNVDDVVLSIPPTDAAKLPLFSSGFYLSLSLWDGVNSPEIVWVTVSPQTGSLTVLRGQEGTSAFGWSAGTQVRSSITAAVLNAALAAYNSGQVLIAGYLPLSGGTLTGPLTLSGLPVSALQAASKSYVDASIGGLLPLAGGSMSGNINMASNRILALPAPITGAEPATKAYVDSDFSLVSSIAADRSGQLVTGGTGAAYTLTSNTGYGPVLADGIQVAFRAHATSQAAAVLSLDGTAAVPLRGKSGAALVPGRIAIGTVWAAEYRLAGPEWLLLDYRSVPTIGTTGGTLSYAVTTGMSIATLQDGLELEIQLNVANTGAITLNVDTLGAVPVRPSSGVEYISGTFAQYSLLLIRYNAATNEWLAKGAPNTATVGTNNLSYSDLTNVGLTVGEVANVLTVNLKTLSGADASVSNPINIPFTDPAGGGLPVWRQVTSALSVATVVGATFGIGNGVPFTLWVAAFDNNGTVQLALSLRTLLGTGGAANIYPIDESIPQNTVAMSGTATATGVWYTPAGVTLTSKSFRLLGHLDFSSGLATAGSFNATPGISLHGAGSKKPGEVIQSQSVSSTTLGSTTSNTFAILTSGTTLTITPTDSAHLIRVHSEGTLSGSSANAAYVQLARGPATPANLIGIPIFVGVTGGASVPARLFSYDLPNVGAPTAVVYGFQGHSTGGATTAYPTAASGVILEAEELQG